MTAFAFAIDAIFADPNMAQAATFRPRSGGADTPCRVILKQPDELTDYGAGRIASETLRIDVRVSEIAAPVEGDLFIVGTRRAVVNGAPMLDREGLVWMCATIPEDQACA